MDQVNFKARWPSLQVTNSFHSFKLFFVLKIGGDSGIGRAVALAFAREGASIVISYLNETEDAEEIQKVIQDEGQECILIVSYLSFLIFGILPSIAIAW